MPNKVSVTGASALLGVAAIEKFLSAGWEVVGVSRRKPNYSVAGRSSSCRSIYGTATRPAPLSSR
jgi:NADP-dependent 3-hydroxy acid dehydrogenase YdfG